MVSRLSSLQTIPGSRMQSCGGTEHLLLILPIRFLSCPPAVPVAALQSHLQQAQRLMTGWAASSSSHQAWAAAVSKQRRQPASP